MILKWFPRCSKCLTWDFARDLGSTETGGALSHSWQRYMAEKDSPFQTSLSSLAGEELFACPPEGAAQRVLNGSLATVNLLNATTKWALRRKFRRCLWSKTCRLRTLVFVKLVRRVLSSVQSRTSCMLNSPHTFFQFNNSIFFCVFPSLWISKVIFLVPKLLSSLLIY